MHSDKLTDPSMHARDGCMQIASAWLIRGQERVHAARVPLTAFKRVVGQEAGVAARAHAAGAAHGGAQNARVGQL